MDFGDRIIKFLVFAGPISALFYYFLYRIGKYLIKVLPAQAWTPPDYDGDANTPSWLTAGALYILLTLVYFLPNLSNISSALIGPPQDNMQNLWNFWWGYNVIVGRLGEFAYSNYIFYPEGTSLLYHSYSWYNLFFSFLLRQINGPVLAYNLLVLHTFVLSGIGAFLLTRYLIGNAYAALLAGFIFAFNPSHFAQSVSHLNIASIQFIPFFVLYYIRSLRDGRRKDLLWATAFFLLNSICSWNYMIFAVYFMGFGYVYLAIRRKQIILFDVLARTVFVVGISIIIMLPWLARMVQVTFTHSGTSAVGHGFYVADLLAFILPHDYHLVGDLAIVKSITGQFTGNIWEKTAYLGLGVLAVIAIAIKGIIRESARYFMALITFVVLSMGVVVHMAGYSSPIFLPYKALFFIPLLSNIRCPSRHIVYGYIFLAIIVAQAIIYLSRTRKFGKHTNYILAGLVLFIALDYYSSERAMTPVYLPRCYNVLMQDGGQGAILDLPGGWVEANSYMMYQTMHQRPIVQGTVSRKFNDTLIDYLVSADLTRQREQLARHGIQYIVVHKSFLGLKNRMDTLAYNQVYDQIYNDKDNIVYCVF
jgi:hypothetical protein